MGTVGGREAEGAILAGSPGAPAARVREGAGRKRKGPPGARRGAFVSSWAGQCASRCGSHSDSVGQ